MKLGAIAGMPCKVHTTWVKTSRQSMSAAAAASPESSHRGPWLRAQTISWNALSLRRHASEIFPITAADMQGEFRLLLPNEHGQMTARKLCKGAGAPFLSTERCCNLTRIP